MAGTYIGKWEIGIMLCKEARYKMYSNYDCIRIIIIH